MRSRPFGAGLALAAALMLTSQPAFADGYSVRDGQGTLQTFASKVLNAVQYPVHLLYGLFNGTTPTPINVDVSGNVGVNVQNLPPGAATSSAQGTANGSLSSIDGKTPALGQSTKSGSVPVTLPNDPDVRTGAASVTAADVASTTIAGQGGVTLYTGTPTVNSSVTWTVNGTSSVSIGVTGTFVATANIEESLDCSMYGPASGKILGFNTSATITAPGIFRVDSTGMACVRVRVASGNFTSGTISALANASSSSGLMQVLNPVPIRGADGATQATTSNPFPTQQQGALPAGTNVLGHVLTDAGSTANVGGYGFQVAPTITVQNAAYSVGNSLGGLVTLTGAARSNGGTGILQGLRIKSNGGLTPTLWVYAWAKTPASTCTDKSAFSNSTSDSAFALPGFPMSVTLSNPGSWDAGTYGQFTQLAMPFKNQDGSPGTAIYLCVVTATAVTPATTSDVSLVAAGTQD